MTEQPTLFDPSTEPSKPYVVRAAEARRDIALGQHERPATAPWRAQALDILKCYLETHAEVFPPDLWPLLPALPPGASATVIGPVIRVACGRGWMTKTGEYRPSPSSNMSPKAVYLSNLYRAAAEAS